MTQPSVLKNKTWQEKVFVAISKKGGSDVDFQAKLNEIGFGGGEKGAESSANMAGGHVVTYSSEEDKEFTGTLYPVGVSSASGKGLDEYFHASDDQKTSTTSVSEYINTLSRDDFRIAVLWTNDSNVTSATEAVGPGDTIQALRYVYKGAQLTNYTSSFDDMLLTADFTFICPPFDETGTALHKVQEYTGDSSESLTALSSYPSS